ncbi:sentrin-specific protease-like [Galendromus occidentalis]|uniref:Sentrin-specific protease-like n=1 Tax=Galendromus occidentalis TaxID=34638 RepID=A0AAJ6VV48_9ACAR|nr:sentrin-specific protease-like [Galendromus occidentalis]
MGKDIEGWQDVSVNPDVKRGERSSFEVPPLPDGLRLLIGKALEKSQDHVVSNISNQRVCVNDLKTLVGLQWLNDVIVNAYMALIVKRNRGDQRLPRALALDVYFHTFLRSNPIAAHQWTQKDDIFHYDSLLVPVNESNHRSLVTIDMRCKGIRYMDSLGRRNDDCLRRIVAFLTREASENERTQVFSNDWHCWSMQDLPRQENGSDCGVFALMFAEHASRDAATCSKQAGRKNEHERIGPP